MPELTGWVLIIVLTGLTGKAIDHVEGFTQGSCAEAALIVMEQLKEQVGEKNVKAFCIPRIGRRF